jgi:hypothetical protein
MAHAAWAKRTIARLSIIGQCQSQKVVAVHHFQATTAREASMTDDAAAVTWAQTIATAWLANCKASYLAAHTQDFTLLNVQSQVLERPANVDHRLTAVDNTPTGGVVGTIGANAEDMVSAVVLKWSTTLAGKSHRGRTYIGPLSATQMDAGLLVAGQVPLYTAVVTALLGQFGPAGAQVIDTRLTIYSRPYNKFEYGYVKGSGADRAWFWPEDYNGDATDVTAGAVDTVLRSQRRRQIGVGS